MNKREKEISKNIIRLLERRCSKEKRSRKISMVTAILLAAMFITGLLTATAGVKNALADYAIYQSGTLAHAQIYGLFQDEYEQIIKDSSVKETAYSLMMGTLAETADGRNYYLEYAEDKKFAWEQKRLTGNLPVNDKDVVLSTDLLQQLGVDDSIGQEIELTWETGGEIYSDVFSLSGYYESDNAVTTEGSYEGWHAPGTYENIYVSKNYVQEKLKHFSQSDSRESYDAGEAAGYGLIQADIKFKNGYNLLFKQDMLARKLKQQVYINYGYLQKDIVHIDIVSLALYGIIILFAAFLAFWIIYSMFQLSITEDSQFWGLLQALGMTEEQFSFFLRQQMIRYCAVGIGAGEILGIVFGNVMMPIVLACFNGTIGYHPVFDPWSLLFSAMICILIIRFSCSRIARNVSGYSSVEIIDMELFQKKKARKKKKYYLGKFQCWRFAWKRISCNMGTFWSNVIPVTVFLLVLMCAVTILKSVDVSFYVDNNLGNIELGIFQKELNESFIKDCSVYINAWKEGIQKPQDWYEIGVLDITLQPGKTEEIFKTKKVQQYLLERDLEKGKVQQGNVSEMYMKLIGMHENAADKMKVVEGIFDKKRFSTGKYVLLTTEQTTGVSMDGKEGWMENPARGCYSVGDKIAIYGKEYEVMAVVEVPYSLDPYTVIDEIPFIMKDSVAESLDPAYCVYGSIYCGKDTCAAQKAARAALSGKEGCVRNIEVVSLEEIQQEVVLFSRLFTVIASFVSVFLGIILLLYVINATVFQVQSQKKMIGMLISMGMQKKQFIVTWLFEQIYEAVTELGLVVTVGSLLSYYVIRSLCESTAVFVYQYSIFPVCLLDLVMAFLTVGLIVYELKKMLQKYEVREMLSED